MTRWKLLAITLTRHNSFSDDIYIQREWTQLRNLWFGEKFENMSMFCKQFHEAAGKGSLEIDDLVVYLNINVLKYKGMKYRRDFARIDVVRYAENRTDKLERKKNQCPYNFITGGRGSNCVYYLEPTDDTWMEFFLKEHVCVNSATISEITNYYSDFPNKDLEKNQQRS